MALQSQGIDSEFNPPKVIGNNRRSSRLQGEQKDDIQIVRDVRHRDQGSRGSPLSGDPGSADKAP